MISDEHVASDRLHALERALRERAHELALYLVYDRPSRVLERPALARTFYAERCVSDDQLERMIDAFRSAGAYVEHFEGERPFLEAVAEGRLKRLGRGVQVVYNGIGFGIGSDAFEPGRKALLPAVADSYGITCANSDAYTCALTAHKFHCFLLWSGCGVKTPATWHFRPDAGWLAGRPSPGTRVIVKSTYEAWSVGVREDSVFVVGDDCESRLRVVAEEIGQPVTVSQFIAGEEIYVTVLACPSIVVPPPLRAVLHKAPGDPNAIMTIDDNLDAAAVSYERLEADPGRLAELRRLAVRVFEVTQMRGMGRIDFRLDEGGVPWVIDAAVSPGLERGGSAHGAFAELGFDHAGFMRAVIAANLADRGLLEPAAHA